MPVVTMHRRNAFTVMFFDIMFSLVAGPKTSTCSSNRAFVVVLLQCSRTCLLDSVPVTHKQVRAGFIGIPLTRMSGARICNGP